MMPNTLNTVGLGGDWQMAFSLEGPSGNPTSIDSIRQAGLACYSAAVPGNFELDLQSNGLIGEPFQGMNISHLRAYEKAHVWYFRRFQASRQLGHRAELVFEGLDCFAEAFVNGRLAGSADNMLIEHAFDVDDLLQGDNEIVVHIRPSLEEAAKFSYPPGVYAKQANYESLYVRKAPHMYGWDIMPRALSAAIWRPVELRYRPLEGISSLYLETLSVSEDKSSARLLLSYEARLADLATYTYELTLEAVCDGSRFTAGRRALFGAGRVLIDVEAPVLWWPRGRGNPDMYEVTVRLLKNGRVIDSRSFGHGIRTVALDRTSITDAEGRGEFCFRINGERVFLMGSNWVPADAYHSRDAARIPRIMELADDIGCNVLRCWGGNVYEDDVFYDICDRKGIMVWQDFAMACAIYPQDSDFCARMETEARSVIRRLRQHPSVVLWSGDNECDCAHWWSGRNSDPNANLVTRQVLPKVLGEEDPGRPYLPSSPYIDDTAYRAGREWATEDHLWGPRDYYKSPFYINAQCHFASEIGYHGSPSVESIRKFISPDKLWPYPDNDEWLLHCTSPVPGVGLYDYRVELMAQQIRALFGEVPGSLEDFVFASQASQAEAKKFFIEFFRGAKWRRTGIIWWNLMDGWPQFSDAVVDYYFDRKLAYGFIKRAQRPLSLLLMEPHNSSQDLVACNDTRDEIELEYVVKDIDTGEMMADGQGVVPADSATVLARIPYMADWQRFYVIDWQSCDGHGRSHYLAGLPPFALETYRAWLKAAELMPRPKMESEAAAPDIGGWFELRGGASSDR